ncbi:hypothetical protein D3C87_2139390 [compost metagenome]
MAETWESVVVEIVPILLLWAGTLKMPVQQIKQILNVTMRYSTSIWRPSNGLILEQQSMQAVV